MIEKIINKIIFQEKLIFKFEYIKTFIFQGIKPAMKFMVVFKDNIFKGYPS